MAFQVKELFRSLQGEGMRAGRAAVFCRFAGCNLWSGREQDRADATCTLCDTDFVGVNGIGGGCFENEPALVSAIIAAFGRHQPEEDMLDPAIRFLNTDTAGMVWNGMGMVAAPPRPYLVFTGGEPALQLTPQLIRALREYRIELAVETNGTMPLPGDMDWVTVSPKAGTHLVVTTGQELKLVWPQQGVDPAQYEHLLFEHFVLQPCDTGDAVQNAAHTRQVMEYCLEHPRWHMGIQLHKLVGFM